ncbi:branched-chain amino acid aminotransferase II [Wolfiporia cocos MD-104 SS10]|uniref:Branched-chain-amino-acid aminotransferase n=1 Tax=Wolfiporia cocos (strain MD-104) TaxID=742152 RepID=A0A2H3J9Z6_WOLCO|nr:branched-chain amino acid aminotransferase II [Wolfiporia cocos MD-104 SS10]
MMLRLLGSSLRYRTGNSLGRCVASVPQARSKSTLADIEASKVQLDLISNRKPRPDPATLSFGKVFTDHMLVIPWKASTGWGTPKIEPYGSFPIEPSASVFHYAACLFEGLKAYRHDNGQISLFRPDMNMKRMNISAQRVALPTFNGDELLELIKQLVRLDKDWIPNRPGYSLYIRPTLIASQPAIGIAPASEALMFVICSPAGPYYPDGFKPVALYGTTEYTRAAPGGIGSFKVGANYAPALVAQKEAAKHGYVQNLWLHGPEHYVTEVGTMNAFAVFRRPKGDIELATPALDGIILPGITRDSVLGIARDHVSGKAKLAGLPDDLVVSERPITMLEVKEAAKAGNLLEFFGTGTAAVISPVDKIGYLGDDIAIPTGPDGMGPISRPIWQQLTGIHNGAIPHPWSVIISE